MVKGPTHINGGQCQTVRCQQTMVTGRIHGSKSLFQLAALGSHFKRTGL